MRTQFQSETHALEMALNAPCRRVAVICPNEEAYAKSFDALASILWDMARSKNVVHDVFPELGTYILKNGSVLQVLTAQRECYRNVAIDTRLIKNLEPKDNA